MEEFQNFIEDGKIVGAADELGYTQAVPVHQYLKNRNLRWNQL